MKSSLLIVDDSTFLHRLIRAYLESEPIEIHSAFSGDEALAAAAQLRPSLILLDVDMPEIDGFEVCRRLKADPATQNLPLIFLTADGSSDDKVKGLNLGASDYITKPFQPDELRARVRAALRGKQQVDKMAMADEVTRLWNRTYLELHLPGQLSLARRTNRPLTCIVGDVDGLAKINESHGEEVGNKVLRKVADTLAGQGREQDIICYLGGGKFMALLPGTNRAGAVQFADRARLEVEEQLKELEGKKIGATASFGVADTQTESDSSLLDRADAALFCAKQSGRNSISISRPTAAQACAIA